MSANVANHILTRPAGSNRAVSPDRSVATATFTELARAGIANTDDFPRLWVAFEATHGDITHSYFGVTSGTAVILTDRGELWFDYSGAKVRNPEVDDLLHRSNNVRIETGRFLQGKERLVGSELVYSLIAYLFALLERLASDAEPTKTSAEQLRKSLAVAERMLTRARSYLDHAAQRLT